MTVLKTFHLSFVLFWSDGAHWGMFPHETLSKIIILTSLYTVANAEYMLAQVTFGRIPGVTDKSNTQGQ